MPVYSYQIALGWNMPDGSLVNIEAISVPNTVLSVEDVFDSFLLDNNTHYFIHGRSTPDRTGLDTPGGFVQNGRERKDWIFHQTSDVAAQYWIDTYEGEKVTVKTTRYKHNVYEKWNAEIGKTELPTEADYLQGTRWYQNIKVPLYLVGTVA